MSGTATRVRKARALANVSQAELARRVGVKRSAVTQWEHPTGTTPSADHMIQIALETGVYFEWLATGRGHARAAVEPASAVIVEDYAHDEHESQALMQLRRMSSSKRRMALEILDILAR